MSEKARATWTQGWAEALEGAGPSATRRIQRGRALARQGAVTDLRVEPGRVTAMVREGRGQLLQARVGWGLPSVEAWELAAQRLGGELRFTAAMLEGALPSRVGRVLEEAGVSLSPAFADLDLSCDCGEAASVCVHVAAVHAASVSRLERDPFLLLRLRGRTRGELIERLRDRAGDAPDGTPDLVVDPTVGIEGARGDLDAIPLRPAPVADPAWLFLHLGVPPGVDDPGPLVEVVERAAATAWRLAAGEGADAADEELLLAELRGQRAATAGSLAEALGRDTNDVRAQLDQLFEAGVVLRTGVGERARYRAAASLRA